MRTRLRQRQCAGTRVAHPARGATLPAALRDLRPGHHLRRGTQTGLQVRRASYEILLQAGFLLVAFEVQLPGAGEGFGSERLRDMEPWHWKLTGTSGLKFDGPYDDQPSGSLWTFKVTVSSHQSKWTVIPSEQTSYRQAFGRLDVLQTGSKRSLRWPGIVVSPFRVTASSQLLRRLLGPQKLMVCNPPLRRLQRPDVSACEVEMKSVP